MDNNWYEYCVQRYGVQVGSTEHRMHRAETACWLQSTECRVQDASVPKWVCCNGVFDVVMEFRAGAYVVSGMLGG